MPRSTAHGVVAFLLLTASSFTVPSPHARAAPAFCSPPLLHGRVAGASPVEQGGRRATLRYARVSGAARLAPLASGQGGAGEALLEEVQQDASTIKEMHFKEETGLNDAVARCSRISLADANYLIFLGAVFVRPLGETKWERKDEPSVVPPGSDVKVYTEPRRFPACAVDWKKRLLSLHPDFAVIDKPPVLPCQAVESNSLETAPACAQAGLGLGRLYLAHRLDAAAEGVLVLARTRGALSRFTKWQQEGKLIRKEYRALTVGTPAVGKLEHFLSPSTRGPGLLRNVKQKGWKRCELKVLSVKPFAPENGISPEVLALARGLPLNEVRVELVTGRRHQIRAQLSAVGAPILGDTLYEPLWGLTLDFEGLSEQVAAEREALLDTALEEAIPPERVALQACQVSMISIDAHAGPPWWDPREQ
ncbi:pseudouridine synthase [Baffinella frigidus]|nr:pseudouridine synthase [Cryptophyta sp. CCMP2293]